MSDIKQQIGDFVQLSGQESTDPDYLAWRDAKVKSAVAHDKANPDQRVPASEVWKKFGLES